MSETQTQTPTTANAETTAAPTKELLKEFGWALVFAAMGVAVILLGSAGPQFIYAGF